jgi:hypothetical protein
MKTFKTTTEKVVSFVLAIAILSTMFINLEIGSLKANASVSKASVSYPVTFYVPETIYLAPSTTGATSFQYFVDCDTNGALTVSRNDTSGQIYFYCNGATSCSIVCNGATVTLGTTSGTNTINTNCTAGTLSTAVTAGTSSTISWTVTYTVNGDTRTATAYTVCWSPFYEPIGTAAYYYNTDGIGGDVERIILQLVVVSGVIHRYNSEPPV